MQTIAGDRTGNRTELVASVLRGLRDLGRGVQELMRRTSDGDTSVASMAVLHRLASDGEMRCSVLAEKTGLDMSVTSRHLAILEQHGLIDRRPDPSDGRAWLNAVNEAGEHTLKKLRATWIAPVQDALTDWDESDLQVLSHYLERLEADLHRASGPSGRREARS